MNIKTLGFVVYDYVATYKIMSKNINNFIQNILKGRKRKWIKIKIFVYFVVKK